VRRTLVDAERAADADRAGAEVHRLLRSNGRDIAVRPVLSALVATALDAAEQSGGLVDPTVAAATIPLRRALGRATPGSGTDRHFPVCGAFPTARPRAATGWRSVAWSERHVAVLTGAALDLTATAKARTARLAAARVAGLLGVGTVVEIGGDVATSGPGPMDGWLVQPAHLDGTTLEIPAGTSLAVCRADGVVDPATGRPVTGPWSAIAVAATDVVLAKTASVAALVQGDAAEEYLEGQGLAAVFLPRSASSPATAPARPQS
jgi:thiamine biosynthesis lipoprotein